MTSYWQLQPIFGSYLLAAVLALAMLCLLLVRPSFGHLTKSRQRTLNVLRMLIALMLLVAMLRPTWIRTSTQAQISQLVVLFDASRSMNHRDADGGGSRWEQQRSILQSALSKLSAMGEAYNVQIIGFSDQLEPLENLSAVSSLPEPTGEETDIGGALLDTIQRLSGKRMAAVFLVSDGSQRAVAPKAPPQQAARQLDRLATPLYTIALGQSRDQSQSRDVAIENLQDEYSVFVKNEFALRVGVRIQGYVGQPIPVTATVEDDAGNQTVLGPVELVATQDSQIAMADFTFRPELPGQYRLRVKAAGQPGETIDNNQRTAFLNVRKGGLRVLLVSSGASQEQKFIRRSLDESQDIELDYFPVSLATKDDWALKVDLLKQLDQYDVFVIGDVDARAFPLEAWQTMRQLVDAGAGLMMYGGYHSFGAGGFAGTALEDVLPVKMNRFEREPDPTKFTRVDRHLEGELSMIPDRENLDHPVMHLRNEPAENERAWRDLKPLRGANKLERLKDQSAVLARSTKGDALLVASNYVSGRVLALATDSTHRWYRFGRIDAHRKFWRQAILWLAKRDRQQANSVFIEMPQRRFQARTKVRFTTGLTDENGDTVVDANLRATLTRPDGSTETIALSTTSDGSNSSQGTVLDTQAAGDYRITVEALDGGLTQTSSYKEFVVEKKDLELADPAANPGLLDMLARMTQRVGGRAIASEQLAGLLDELKANPPSDEIETQSRWQLGDTPADAWSYFLVLVALLCTEWFLRKRWGLV